jgi:hypothetical protein
MTTPDRTFLSSYDRSCTGELITQVKEEEAEGHPSEGELRNRNPVDFFVADKAESPAHGGHQGPEAVQGGHIKSYFHRHDLLCVFLLRQGELR